MKKILFVSLALISMGLFADSRAIDELKYRQDVQSGDEQERIRCERADYHCCYVSHRTRQLVCNGK